jgi:group II intron reverse transcriptase/maturase
MTLKPQVKFDHLFSKLYNSELWLLAYQNIASKPGNLTAGVDGKTIDGAGMKLINNLIAELKASSYRPKPVRRVYIPKANSKLRPLGIPTFRDKLLMSVLKLILEAIYEPTFSEFSHGFRPNRSCHTALDKIKKMSGIRWWVEGDIVGFFDHVGQSTLLRILNKRISDQRFLHLIGQLLKAGYVENWKYHQTYSGVAQGGNLSPVLSNVYLNELDQAITQKIAEFNTGKKRALRSEYTTLYTYVYLAKKKARASGNWAEYKRLRNKKLNTQATDPQDPNFRRLTYVRYCDDFLLGVIGSKKEAQQLKNWLSEFLQQELELELSPTKTLITNAKNRVRFLGYDIRRWPKRRILRVHTKQGVKTQRTVEGKLELLMPYDKLIQFGKEYGDTSKWVGKHRNSLINLSELEILKTYNAEIRGFTGYYSLADNLKTSGAKLLHLTTTSFLATVANKRKSSIAKVCQALKKGPARYVASLRGKDGKTSREYELVASTKQLKKDEIDYGQPDVKPNTAMYRTKTELGKRLLANQCEWCGTEQGQMEVHHVRKLADLKGKTRWERQMQERKRKTMVLCQKCHTELHTIGLSEKKHQTAKGKLESRIPLTG